MVWQRVQVRGGEGSFSAAPGVSEAQRMWPMDLSLWCVRCYTGGFYKSSSDTHCSRHLTKSKKARERTMSTHSRGACFPSAWYSSCQGVVFHPLLNPTNMQYVCDCLQLFKDTHNNKSMMTSLYHWAQTSCQPDTLPKPSSLPIRWPFYCSLPNPGVQGVDTAS